MLQPTPNTRRIVRRITDSASSMERLNDEIPSKRTTTRKHELQQPDPPKLLSPPIEMNRRDSATPDSLSSSSSFASAPASAAPDENDSVKSETQPLPTLTLDRAVFSSVSFFPSTFVNNIANVVLFKILQKYQRNAKLRLDLDEHVNQAVWSLPPPRLRASDGSDLFSSPHISPGFRQKYSSESENVDYRETAKQLSAVLGYAAEAVEKLLEEEKDQLRRQEARCKWVKIQEMQKLGAVRMGLESTTARLHAYGNRVANAQAAAEGIEEHLSQSNARVQRGKAVVQLLRHFKSLTSLDAEKLAGLLKALSKVRSTQRVAVTERWASGDVSPSNPRYFAAPSRTVGNGTTSVPPRSVRANGLPKPKDAMSSDLGKGNGEADNLKRHGEENEEDAGLLGEELADVKLDRVEAAAVASGLDRVFASRSYTEAQVEWCQKLLFLSLEIGNLVGNAKNIEIYVSWLREELVADLFHVVGCFKSFYNRGPQEARHQPYSSALLKTMELVSRLHSTITPSNDALQKIFFSKSINDLGLALFSEYNPTPLPNPTVRSSGPAPISAMAHFAEHMEKGLEKAFVFLAEQVQRDVIVVETIFGTVRTVRQQLLAEVTEGVVKPFVEQQIKLAETFQIAVLDSDASLSPRSRRKFSNVVADAIAYYHTVEVSLFLLFQKYICELKKSFTETEVEFLNRSGKTIFAKRATYGSSRAELDLLERYHKLIEEKYTRQLHIVPDQCFDVREAHMTKTKELIDRLTEVATRVRTYALPQDVASYILALIKASFTRIGAYLDEELSKTLDAIRADRETWRQKPKSEEELLKPQRTESQQCGFRMLLFAQSSLMQLWGATTAIIAPLLETHPRLSQDVDEVWSTALEVLDERAEKLLNMCAQAIIVRALSILIHYQTRNDYCPHDSGKNDTSETEVAPCSRACTLFCYYITRQFEVSKEFIRKSNDQIARRQPGMGGMPGVEGPQPSDELLSFIATLDMASSSHNGTNAFRARIQTMNLQQLIYGNGEPSSFVRTVGVCLYRGISAHVRSFVVNDRGALVYKQDMTAYKEAMAPLGTTPGPSGALVDTLFQILKETSNLLLMPLDCIKEVKHSGMLRLMNDADKVRFIKMRKDVRAAYKSMSK
ncbi:unnamed protein product [Phytomonas sp. EM1]|nr:unnamed protein product [Phytomonas sp. EM1]|eukprot:CCW63766.1 unnamed protein product [Phytomonas sp. isolate EM1]